MKDPWEVYFESFEHHLRGLPIPKFPVDSGSEESKAFGKAFLTARESTLYHLVEDLHWTKHEARHLADEFFTMSIDWIDEAQEAGLPALEERLRHQYTDWVLRRR